MFRLAAGTTIVVALLLVWSGGQLARGGVVAHWRFQEGPEDSPAILILDSSGNFQHGAPFGDPMYRAVDFPDSDLALEFDGTNDRVLIADHDVFQLTESLTLEAYVQIDRYRIQEQIVFRGDDRGGLDPWYLGVYGTGQLLFSVQNASNGHAYLLSPELLPLGSPVHVAGTLDHATGQQKLYINGQEVASQTTSIRPLGPLVGPTPGVSIGNVQGSAYNDQWFDGLIDEVRISDEALDPSELLPPLPEPPEQIVLNFDEHAAMTYWDGNLIPEAARLSDDYLDTHGVVFESGYNSYVAVVDCGDWTTSEPNGIGSASSGNRLTYNADNPIIISFFDPTNPSIPGVTDFVAIRGDMFADSGQSQTLEAFDIDGNLLDSDLVFDGGGQTLSVSAVGIHSVKFTGPDIPLYGGGGGVVLDDFTFNAIVPIPEPSTIILLLTGAIGLLVYRTRRRHK